MSPGVAYNHLQVSILQLNNDFILTNDTWALLMIGSGIGIVSKRPLIVPLFFTMLHFPLFGRFLLALLTLTFSFGGNSSSTAPSGFFDTAKQHK